MATTYKLIDKTVLVSSQAFIEFTGLGAYSSDYTDLKLVFTTRSTAGTSAESDLIQFNGSTSNFNNKRVYGFGTTTGSDTNNRWIAFSDAGGATANTFSNSEVYIPNYSSSNNKAFSSEGVQEDNSSTAFVGLAAGLWSDVAAITSIRITNSSGDYVSGSSFYLYGIKNS
jgi:hypothetical protein